MKKHFTLFFVYAALIIAGLSLFLIFYNKKEGDMPPINENTQEETNNTNKEEQEGGGTENDNENNSGGGTNEDVDNTIYATNLTLNCAREIDIEPNSFVEIVGNYLTIEPSNANVTITITAESGNVDDLTFKNNVITTKGKGKYRIKFSSQKNKTTQISDTLVVNVKDTISPLILCKLSVFTVGEKKELSDFFTFDNSISNKIIKTDNKITYSNSMICANTVGDSVITILYDIGMFRFTYMANLTIKDVPLYTIVITDYSSSAIVDGDTIEYSCKIGKSLEIFYAIKNRNEDYVDQFVEISLDNPSVASYVLTEPKIKVTCLSKGCVNLTITCANDKESKLVLKISFI